MQRLLTIIVACVVALSQLASAQDLIAATEGIARQLASAVATAGYQSVAVIDPLDPNDDPSAFGRFIAEELSGAMVNAGQLRVIDRLSLQRILEEQRLSVSGLVNDADAVQRVGDLAGVEVLIVGTYFVLGSNVRLSLKGLNVQTAQSVAAVNTTLSVDEAVTNLLGSTYVPSPRTSSNASNDEAFTAQGGAASANFSTDVEYDPSTGTFYVYNLCDADAWIEFESKSSYSNVAFVLTPNAAMQAQALVYVGGRLAHETTFVGSSYGDDGRSRPASVSAFVGPNAVDRHVRVVLKKYRHYDHHEWRCRGVFAISDVQIQ